MLFRRPTTIRREGWYYLAITVIVFGGAIVNDVNLLLILGGLLLGPLVLNWRVVTTNLRRLHIERRLPHEPCAGDLFSVGLNLGNLRRRVASWVVVVEDQIRREARNGRDALRRRSPLRPSVLFPYVPAGEVRKGGYRGRIAERGRYRFGPLRVSTQFPFGLFSRTITLGETETLLVLPRLGRLTEGWSARRLVALAGGDRRRGQAGPEGDFYGVRDWQTGDGRRLVHWRASARLGKLVVRQFERSHNRDVAVVLDLWQSDTSADAHLENVELAVSFAATVLADACRKGGSNVYLAISNAGPELVGGPASSALLQGLMEQLAVVEAPAHDTLPALLAHALVRIASGTEIVLVSAQTIDLTDAERLSTVWADPLVRDRARHIRCIDTSSHHLAEFFQAE
jgi:uncharacterized protein (DUF58 family)